MKIEVGGEYRTRDRQKVKIVNNDGHDTYPFDGDNHESYTEQGFVFGPFTERPSDLVAPWSESATDDSWITWDGGECPVAPDTVVEVRLADDDILVRSADTFYWKAANSARTIVAYRVVSSAHLPVTMQPNACDILAAAAGHIGDRASTYDQAGKAERSMARTVAVFNALHDTTLTEAQGWSFMECLKAVRGFQNGFNRDSVEDMAAYVALRGEAQVRAEGDKA